MSHGKEYTKKELSPKAKKAGLFLTVLGIVLIAIGFGVSSEDDLSYVRATETTQWPEIQKKEHAEKFRKVGMSIHDSHGATEAHASKSSSHKKEDSHSNKDKADSHAGDTGHHSGGYVSPKGQRIWANVLIAFMFILSIGLGSLFFVGLEHMVGANWSTPLRRIKEIFAGVLFLAFIIGVFFIFGGGLESIYSEWLDPDSHDKILMGKIAYLNKEFFLGRFFFCFAVLGFYYWIFRSHSLKQDEDKDQIHTKRCASWAPTFIMVFALSLTILSIDFFMTMTPHWFSTMFGVSYFGAATVGSLATIILACVYLKENDYLHPRMKNDTFYSIAALLFGFNCFWAYISFCQFMLIWYSNLPEETFWYLSRWEGDWYVFSLFLIIFHLIIPFFALISKAAKTNLGRLKFMSIWLLVAHYIDLYWHVVPTLSKEPVFGLIEIGFMALCPGLIILTFTFFAKDKNLVPVGDPKLERGLGFRLH